MKYFIAFLLFFSTQAMARPFHEVGYSIRAMGMGNAFTAIVNDSDALFYNPAALSKVEGINWTVGTTNIGANGMDIYETVTSLSDVQGVEDYSRLYGDYLWLTAGGKMALTLPNFGVAYYHSGQMNFELQSPSMPRLDAGFIYDQGIILGGSFELLKNVHLGAAAKRVIRQGGAEVIGIGTIAGGDFDQIQAEFQGKGIGYGLDLGLLVEMEGPLKPTLGVAWKDVGFTTFVPVSGADSPPIQAHDLTVGLGVQTELPLLTVSAALDVKHILDNEEQFGKKLHMGMELDFPMVDVRGGFYQGYYTLGLGVNLLFFEINIASYGVERGVYPGQIEDRRYEIELIMEFGFDADFSIPRTGTGNTSRRLKQRR